MPDAVTEYYRRRERRLQMRADSTGSTGRRNALLRAIRRNRKRELREDDDGNSGWVTLESDNHVLIENSTVVGGAGGSLNGTTLSSAKSTMSSKQKTLAKLNNKLSMAKTNRYYSTSEATRETLKDCPVGTVFKYHNGILLKQARKTGDNTYELIDDDGKVVARDYVEKSISGVPIFTDYMGGANQTNYTEQMPAGTSTEEWSTSKEYKAARAKAEEDYNTARNSAYQEFFLERSQITVQRQKVSSEYWKRISEAKSAGDTDEVNRLRKEMENANAEFAALTVTANDVYHEKCDEAERTYLSVFDVDYRYKKISGEHSMEEDGDPAVINPKGLTKNCQRCAVAYELRRRGYDVRVSAGESGELGKQNSIESCFQDTEKTYISGNDNSLITNVEQITELMQSYGKGARALISVAWNGYSFGHAFNLEVGNDNKVYIVDSQVGMREELTATGKSGQRFKLAEDCVIIRTDTAKLTSRVEEYAVRNTKAKSK